MICICTTLFDPAYIMMIEFHTDFLAKLFVNQMVVFSVLGVWDRRSKHPCVPGAEGIPGTFSVKTGNVSGIPECIGLLTWAFPWWLTEAFPRFPTSCSTAHQNFPVQVGQKLNCNKSECFVDVSSVSFFGICSFFSIPLFVERPNVVFLP